MPSARMPVVSLIFSAASSAAATSRPRAATNSRSAGQPTRRERGGRLRVRRARRDARRAARRARRASNGTGPSAAATAATASNWPVTVLVAGTARSGPAPSAITTSAALAERAVASLTIATVRAPASPQPLAHRHDLRRLARLAERDDQQAAVVERARRTACAGSARRAPPGGPRPARPGSGRRRRRGRTSRARGRPRRRAGPAARPRTVAACSSKRSASARSDRAARPSRRISRRSSRSSARPTASSASAMAPRSGAVVHERGRHDLGRERGGRGAAAARARPGSCPAVLISPPPTAIRAGSSAIARFATCMASSSSVVIEQLAGARVADASKTSAARERRRRAARSPRSPIARPPTNSSSGAWPVRGAGRLARAAQAVADLAGRAVGAVEHAAADDDRRPRSPVPEAEQEPGSAPRRRPSASSASAAALTSLPTAERRRSKRVAQQRRQRSSSQPGHVGREQRRRPRRTMPGLTAPHGDAAAAAGSRGGRHQLAGPRERALDGLRGAVGRRRCRAAPTRAAGRRGPPWRAAIFVPPKSMPSTKSREMSSAGRSATLDKIVS